jgi:uncharacterized delta-60 repeat protein
VPAVAIAAAVVTVGTSLALAPAGALATAGALDPSLAHRGIVSLPWGTWSAGVASAVQRDGKIVTVGQTELQSGKFELISTRMYPNGRLDPGYGNGGVVLLSIGGSGGGDAVKILRDGSILIAGAGKATTRAPLAFAAVKLHPDGTLDKTFGNGGITTVQVGREAVANALAVQRDGKIVLGGIGAIAHNVFAAARLNPDGSVDQSFGNGGVATLPQDGAAWGMALAPDGRIILAGEASVGDNTLFDLLTGLGLGVLSRTLSNNRQYMVAALQPNGKPDTSFGNGGVVRFGIGSTSICTAIAVQPDGRIVVTGSTFSHKLLVATVRLMPNGTFDQSFGTGGVSQQVVEEAVNAVALQRDGDIVIGATGPTAIRLLPNGQPDSGFGTDGVVNIQQVRGNAANGVAIDPRTGNIVLAGVATLSGRLELSVIRLRGS